ncbi:MAG TPA: RNA-binding S4 domain-containing protein [Candidatus Acidoferrum sp.]|nr:RNA-binding S4 domain-containing protein [Candidatus Acidoferrum sp.]
MSEEDGRRLDKWLWFARFCKSRTLASKLCAAGKIRIGGELVHKAHYLVRPGDVLTFPQGPHIRVVRVLQLGVRRGPATEARTLYEDLEPPQPRAPALFEREPGAGRPTKAERRALDRLRSEE